MKPSGDGAAVASLEEAEERLCGVPPDAFVSLRDELVRALRARGDEAGARSLAALRRPTLALWALNQLPRRFAREVAALLAAGERLRDALGGDPEVLREAIAEERRWVAALVAAAGRILGESGAANPEAHLERVRRNLQAAAGASEEERQRLRRGTLRAEIESFGFETAFSAMGSAAPKREQPTAAPSQQRARRLREEAADVARRVASERRELLEAERLLQELEETVREAERALAAAREQLAASARACDLLRESIGRGESQARELREKATAVEAAAMHAPAEERSEA